MHVCSPTPEKGHVLVEWTIAKKFSDQLQQIERKLDRLYATQKEDATMYLSERNASERNASPAVRYSVQLPTYKVLTATQPPCLDNLIYVHRSTSSQHSLFISRHSRSTINIIIVTYN